MSHRIFTSVHVTTFLKLKVAILLLLFWSLNHRFTAGSPVQHHVNIPNYALLPAGRRRFTFRSILSLLNTLQGQITTKLPEMHSVFHIVG